MSPSQKSELRLLGLRLLGFPDIDASTQVADAHIGKTDAFMFDPGIIVTGTPQQSGRQAFDPEVMDCFA